MPYAASLDHSVSSSHCLDSLPEVNVLLVADRVIRPKTTPSVNYGQHYNVATCTVTSLNITAIVSWGDHDISVNRFRVQTCFELG